MKSVEVCKIVIHFFPISPNIANISHLQCIRRKIYDRFEDFATNVHRFVKLFLQTG